MRNSLLLALASLICLFSACRHVTNHHLRNEVDSLNERAYRLRYVDIDTVETLARRAAMQAQEYADGRREALCHLAFVEYQRMNFDGVDSLLTQVRKETTGDLLLLCTDVLEMKVCQRTGDGERFFRVKSRAEELMQKLSRREARLPRHEVALWVYAQTEYHIITSTYYFYQEQDAEARSELARVPDCLRLQVDTAQWIYYNYMLGSGGLVEGHDAADIALQEFDYLFRAYISARRDSLRYFEANSLQAFATMFLTRDSLIRAERSDAHALLAIQHAEWQAGEEGLPLAFARHALALFKSYDDLFQTACTYRTLGEIYFQQGNCDLSLDRYTQALHCVNRHHLRYYGSIAPDTLAAFAPDALTRSVEQEWIDDPRVSTVPEWISGIRQQLSLTYSAMGMKQASDYNRNIYLDLVQATNQNQELENRTAELQRRTRALRWRMVLCVVLLIVAWFSFRLRVGKKRARLEERQEELEEALQMSRRGVESNKRQNVENRAKVSLVHGIIPFLDRIGGEVGRMMQTGHVTAERREYIVELVDEIERHNAVLTEWIKLEQGQLNLHVTTFPLDKLFQIVAEGHYSFDQKQVRFVVEPAASWVKADESLTLFMINTLCDNARKFTPAGGTVALSARETEEYVEVSVADTGCGLSEEDVKTLMHDKVYDATQVGKGREGKGFGFGLMNCRGIIEKYKKTSALFACCVFGVKSELGTGSTFFFRLPRMVRPLVLVLSALLPRIVLASFILLSAARPCMAQDEAVYYDSLYQANLEGRYPDAVHYATRVVEVLNAAHPDQPPMLLNDADGQQGELAEILWARDGVPVDYELIVGLRNELALAALALNEWEAYRYNNRACIRLHRYIHQDRELPTYFRRLKRTIRTSNLLLVAILLIASLILLRIAKTALLPLGRLREGIADMEDEQAKLDFEHNRLYVQNQILGNCLSTIKHEAMYYPSRIRILAERVTDDDIDQLAELVQYYRHIYTLLCKQADEQVGQPGFKRQCVEVAAMLNHALAAGQRMTRRRPTVQVAMLPAPSVMGSAVLGDALLLQLLVESLVAEMLGHDGARLTLSASDDGAFVRFTLRDAATTLSDEELSNLFFPDARHIPCLVAKQILREHDTYANHPGCRLVAQQAPSGGYEIFFTLVKDNRQ